MDFFFFSASGQSKRKSKGKGKSKSASPTSSGLAADTSSGSELSGSPSVLQQSGQDSSILPPKAVDRLLVEEAKQQRLLLKLREKAQVFKI